MYTIPLSQADKKILCVVLVANRPMMHLLVLQFLETCRSYRCDSMLAFATHGKFHNSAGRRLKMIPATPIVPIPDVLVSQTRTDARRPEISSEATLLSEMRSVSTQRGSHAEYYCSSRNLISLYPGGFKQSRLVTLLEIIEKFSSIESFNDTG